MISVEAFISQNTKNISNKENNKLDYLKLRTFFLKRAH